MNAYHTAVANANMQYAFAMTAAQKLPHNEMLAAVTKANADKAEAIGKAKMAEIAETIKNNNL